MDEFDLIDDVVAVLGARAAGDWIRVGPGDDAAVIAPTPGCHQVASIDSLVADVHFPADAPADVVGYRAMMVSLSDLAAMAATPRYVLIALVLPTGDAAWAVDCARGIFRAAQACDVYVCGGNFSSGPLSVTVSVHGEVPAGAAVLRSGARPGQGLFVSGALGGAAACVRRGELDLSGPLTPLQQCYARPRARFDTGPVLRAQASAAIDISDGLLQDLGHLCRASGVQAHVDSRRVPLVAGAEMEDALNGGDDYQILCAADGELEGFVRIGGLQSGDGVYLDDERVTGGGYAHFGA